MRVPYVKKTFILSNLIHHDDVNENNSKQVCRGWTNCLGLPIVKYSNKYAIKYHQQTSHNVTYAHTNEKNIVRQNKPMYGPAEKYPELKQHKPSLKLEKKPTRWGKLRPQKNASFFTHVIDDCSLFVI